MRVFGRKGRGLAAACILQTHLSDDEAVAKMGHPVAGLRWFGKSRNPRVWVRRVAQLLVSS